jgi:hypothetical protein
MQKRDFLLTLEVFHQKAFCIGNVKKFTLLRGKVVLLKQVILVILENFLRILQF